MEERDDIKIELDDTELEDLDTEDTDIADGEELTGQKLKKLKEKLKLAEKDKMSALEDLQRARADFLNARKRMEEERVSDRERVKLQYIEDMLPLCDSFFMALNDPAFLSLGENLKKGVLGINMQLTSILRGYGVEEVGKIGDKFDPHEHEALADEGDTGNVKDVLQKGYKMKDRIIRPAKVIVG